MAKERDVHSTANPFDVDAAAKPIRTSSASTDSATTVSPETPALNKKDDKENVAQGTTVGKKDKKMSRDVKVKQAVKKTKANAPPVIVIEDSDEEDQDFQGMCSPPMLVTTHVYDDRNAP